MSIEQQLRTALHDGADQLHLPGAGAEAARRRARRIARRRRAVPAALTATMVTGASATMWLRRDDPDSSVVAAGGSTATPTVVDSDFTWREAEGVVSSPRHIVRGDDGTYYALSTAPGTRSANHENGIVPQALYRSNDGVTWEAADLGAKPWMIDVDERAGVLYAVGTSPATQERDTLVRTSSDGGNSWDGVSLPTIAEPPTTSVPMSGQSSTARIAVGDEVMVAFLQTTYYLDLDAVLTDEDRAANRYAMETPEGIAIVENGGLAGAPCADMPEVRCATEVADAEALERQRSGAGTGGDVVRTIPWPEIGLSGPDDLSVNEAFVSSDGHTWETVESPFTRFGPTDVVATPGGFVATVSSWDDGTSELLRSADGRSWESVSAGLGVIDHVGVVGDRLVALRSDYPANASVTLMTSDDAGASWTVADLSSVFDPEGAYSSEYVSAFDAGPMGVALVIAGAAKDGQQPSSALLTSPDGLTWSIEPLADVVGANTSGSDWIDWVLVGENDVVVHATGYSADAGPVSKSFVGTPTR